MTIVCHKAKSPSLNLGPLPLLCHSDNLMNILLLWSDGEGAGVDTRGSESPSSALVDGWRHHSVVKQSVWIIQLSFPKSVCPWKDDACVFLCVFYGRHSAFCTLWMIMFKKNEAGWSVIACVSSHTESPCCPALFCLAFASGWKVKH